MGKRILMAGASGLVGSHVVRLLQQSNAIAEIHLLTRRTLDLEPTKIHQHQVDFSNLVWNQAVEMVICTLGTTIKKAGSQEAFRRVDFDYVVALGKIAAQLRVPMIIVSSLGADASSNNSYLRTKGEADQTLTDLNLPGLRILRPSLMYKGRQEMRPGERVAGAFMAVFGPLMMGPLRNYRAIDPAKVAACIVKLAEGDITGVEIINSASIATDT